MGAYIKAHLEREKRITERAFAIIQKECYFCKAKELLRFNEHYYFCPTCTVLYTHLLIHDSECKHISKYSGIPTTMRTPWYDGYAHTRTEGLQIHIWQSYEDELHRCSVCHGVVNCDGW